MGANAFMLAAAEGAESFVSFPKLGLKFNIERSFSVFGLDIYWYGVIICIGMLLCIILGMRHGKKYNLETERMLDYVLCAVPSAIVGARLYYVVFSWDIYKGDISAIFDIRSGGLAIYGGIIGAALAILIMARIRKDKFLHLIDFAMPYIMLGQAIGRWGNFVNQEAYGAETDSIFGMTGSRIAEEMGENVLVHPTFLYESLWCFAGFAFLLFFRSKLQKNYGEVTALYMIIYGIERALVEGLRTDSLMISAGSVDIRVSQLLSIVLVVIGVALFIDSRMRGASVIRGCASNVPKNEGDNPCEVSEDEEKSSISLVIEAMKEASDKEND